MLICIKPIALEKEGNEIIKKSYSTTLTAGGFSFFLLFFLFLLPSDLYFYTLNRKTVLFCFYRQHLQFVSNTSTQEYFFNGFEGE